MATLFISSDVIGALRRYLEEENIELPAFQAELTEMEKRSRLSFELWWGLLDKLNEQLNEPALGTQIGSKITLKQGGILGYLTQTSATMLEAFQCFERFQRLLYEGNSASIHWQEDVCTLTWSQAHGTSTQISDEVVLSSLLSAMRYCLQDPSAGCVNVCFSGQPMGPLTLYQHYYGGEVRFGQPNISISIDSKYLLEPLVFSDPSLHGLLLEQAANKLPPKSLENDFMVTLKRAVMRALHEGKPTASHIAGKLHISSRTLHRQLDKQGYIFRELLKEVRKNLAMEYLADDHLSLSETALLLGYSEQSAFSRAFLGWFGVTPNVYRSDNKLSKLK